MVGLAELWFAILLSGVLVFIASSIIHMALPIHKGDYKKLPDEEGVQEAIRSQSVEPGDYMFPCAGSMKEAYTPEMMEKWKQGPVGMLTVLPSGVPSMGKNLVQWFLYIILISVIAGYVATISLAPGAAYMTVFRVTGTIAVLGYGLSYIPASIWKGVGWGTTLKFIFDGVVYGLLTAGVFGWQWPDAA